MSFSIFALTEFQATPELDFSRCVFAKSPSNDQYYIIVPFSSRASGTPHAFKSFEIFLSQLPLMKIAPYWNNYSDMPDDFRIAGLELIALEELELRKIENTCLAGKRIFARMGDGVHPSLK